VARNSTASPTATLRADFHRLPELLALGPPPQPQPVQAIPEPEPEPEPAEPEALPELEEPPAAQQREPAVQLGLF
jgi:hypothetical protein